MTQGASIQRSDENDHGTEAEQGEEWRLLVNDRLQRLRLTTRQREVLLLLEQGKPIADVADLLNIEILTVRSHLRDIRRALHVSRWYDAVQEARRLHLLPPKA